MSVKIQILDYKYLNNLLTWSNNSIKNWNTNAGITATPDAVGDAGILIESSSSAGTFSGFFSDVLNLQNNNSYTLTYTCISVDNAGQTDSKVFIRGASGGDNLYRPIGNNNITVGTHSYTFTMDTSLNNSVGNMDVYFELTNGNLADKQIKIKDVKLVNDTVVSNMPIDWTKSIVGELDVTDHSEFPLAMTFQISDIKDITSTSGDYSKTFKIPATKNNNNLLKHLYTANSSNTNIATENKPCEILVNDLYSLIGTIKVTGIGGYGEKASYYNCVFYGSNLSWALDLDNQYMNTIDWETYGDNLVYQKPEIIATWQHEKSDDTTSPIVYPITSYGDFNSSVQEPYIQLLDTKYAALGTGSALTIGYSGYFNNTSSYNTPTPSSDWRPAVFVKTTLDKIFKKVGYTINSTFMDTDMFKKLVWLLPNFKYNNVDDRLKKYAAEAEFVSPATLPFQTITENNISSTPFWVTKPLELGTTGTYFNLTTETSNTDITYTNATGSGGGSEFLIAEYGFYNISVFNWAVQISDVTVNGGTSFLLQDFLGVEKFRLAVQVKTVGQVSWNTIDFIDSDINKTSGGNDWAFWLGRVQENERLVNFDNLTGIRRFLNKGDKIRFAIQAKIEGIYDGIGEDWSFRINPKPNNANITFAFAADFVEYGQTYNLNDVINKDYKQTDFIKGIAHAFNLKMSTDITSRTINIEPFDSFYQPYGSAIDWTYKLDRSKEITDKWFETDLNKTFIFKYKTDNKDATIQYRGNEYFKGVEDEYPYQEELSGNFKRGETIFENPFFAGSFNAKDQDTTGSSSSYTDNLFSACLWGEKEDGSLTSPNDWARPSKGNEFLPRLLYWNKQTCPSCTFSGLNEEKKAQVQTWNGIYKVISATDNISTHLSNIYPQATSIDFDNTNSPVLSYGNIWGRNYDFTTASYTSLSAREGLYDTYYRYMFEMIKQTPRLRTVYIDLKITDITDLDFRKLIYLDGVYWRINKINDYMPNNNKPTKVELIEWIETGSFATQAPAFGSSGNGTGSGSGLNGSSPTGDGIIISGDDFGMGNSG